MLSIAKTKEAAIIPKLNFTAPDVVGEGVSKFGPVELVVGDNEGALVTQTGLADMSWHASQGSQGRPVFALWQMT